MAKRIAQFIGTLAAIAVGLFLFVANFSAVETRYQCSGTISRTETPSPATIFVKLETYRWWVHLWADDDGSFWYEIPNETVGYFSDVIEAGDQMQIWEFQKKGIAGNFSTLSKALTLKVPGGFFDGTCNKIEA
jgi:hypothetical protein